MTVDVSELVEFHLRHPARRPGGGETEVVVFYTFMQNNSYGRWVENDDLAAVVIIEARNPAEANAKAQFLGVYFDPDLEIDCECCGTRWDPAEERDGTPYPAHYEEDVSDGLVETYHTWTDPVGYVHFLDGSKLPLKRRPR